MAFVATARLAAQAPVDSALAASVARIRAIDAHAHPMRPVARGAPPDTEYDALPLDGIPPFALPARLRPEHAAWRAAQRALYGVTVTDTGTAATAPLVAAGARVQAEQGMRFPAWALDQAGVETMLANRVAMGPGLDAPRFRWVSFVDALMLPLDVRGEATRSPDVRPLYPREAALLHRYLRDLGLRALPPTLDAYVRQVVAPTLDRQRRAGAVAVKFEAAYLRPLDFDDPDPALARRIYARYAAGGTPTHAEYKALEDYLFREIAREAGRRMLAVQIHVLDLFGGFYSPRGSAPHLLEPAFNDSSLRATEFRHRPRRLAARRRDAGVAREAERVRRHLDDRSRDRAGGARRRAASVARRVAGEGAVWKRRLRRWAGAGLGAGRVGRRHVGPARADDRAHRDAARRRDRPVARRADGADGVARERTRGVPTAAVTGTPARLTCAGGATYVRPSFRRAYGRANADGGLCAVASSYACW